MIDLAQKINSKLLGGARMDAQEDSRRNIAHVHSMLRELKNMAEAERCDLLSHLLEMAYLESGDILRGSRPVRSNKNGAVFIGK